MTKLPLAENHCCRARHSNGVREWKSKLFQVPAVPVGVGGLEHSRHDRCANAVLCGLRESGEQSLEGEVMNVEPRS